MYFSQDHWITRCRAKMSYDMMGLLYYTVCLYPLHRTITPYNVVRLYRACCCGCLRSHWACTGRIHSIHGTQMTWRWLLSWYRTWQSLAGRVPVLPTWTCLCQWPARGKWLLLVCIQQGAVSQRFESELWQPPLWDYKVACSCAYKRTSTKHTTSKGRLHAIAGNVQLFIWAGS